MSLFYFFNFSLLIVLMFTYVIGFCLFIFWLDLYCSFFDWYFLIFCFFIKVPVIEYLTFPYLLFFGIRLWFSKVPNFPVKSLHQGEVLVEYADYEHEGNSKKSKCIISISCNSGETYDTFCFPNMNVKKSEGKGHTAIFRCELSPNFYKYVGIFLSNEGYRSIFRLSGLHQFFYFLSHTVWPHVDKAFPGLINKDLFIQEFMFFNTCKLLENQTSGLGFKDLVLDLSPSFWISQFNADGSFKEDFLNYIDGFADKKVIASRCAGGVFEVVEEKSNKTHCPLSFCEVKWVIHNFDNLSRQDDKDFINFIETHSELVKDFNYSDVEVEYEKFLKEKGILPQFCQD